MPDQRAHSASAGLHALPPVRNIHPVVSESRVTGRNIIVTALCHGGIRSDGVSDAAWPVSYTHLDVYKRQPLLFGAGYILK